MVPTLGLTMIESGRCGGCGRHHRFRVATVDDEGVPARALCGFFERCPATEQRTWYVIALPTSAGRLLKVGPPDDECWVPELAFEPAWSTVAETAIDLATPGRYPDSPPRGNGKSGFRVPSPGSDRLRRALGCPHIK